MTFAISRAVASVIVVSALAAAWPAAAQTTGMLQGTVKDAKGQPIEGARITIEKTDGGVPAKFETKTGKKGDYLQIGLPPGSYKVTAEKDKVSHTEAVGISGGETSTAIFVLVPAAAGAPAGQSGEAAAKAADFLKSFKDGVDAAQAKRFDDAAAKFTHTIELNPNCVECYYNLATVYNAQKKYEQAVAASERGTELATASGRPDNRSADAIFNQGVILWNAGKLADAKKQYELALKVDPNHAESHYWLGVALVSEGNTAAAADEFDAYLKIAPNGLNAASAADFLAQTRKK
jgi:tetratricopeptide (TPR) repeat protein